MNSARQTLGRIRNAFNYAMGLQTMNRSFQIREDDCFITSYPKSGNTWLRFLVANLLQADKDFIGFDKIEEVVPDPHLHTERYLNALASPRYFKSHSGYDARQKKVLFVVRDPRDIAVSYFRFQKKMRWSTSDSIEHFVSDFVSGNVDAYGPWHLHTGSWLPACKYCPESFLMVRYEDLQSDCENELSAISKFFGINASPSTIKATVEKCSAKNMQQDEQKHGGTWKPIKSGDKQIPFVGTAKSNQWQSKLPQSSSREIETAFSDIMLELGYQL